MVAGTKSPFWAYKRQCTEAATYFALTPSNLNSTGWQISVMKNKDI